MKIKADLAVFDYCSNSIIFHDLPDEIKKEEDSFNRLELLDDYIFGELEYYNNCDWMMADDSGFITIKN